jgi:hypothetical protein
VFYNVESVVQMNDVFYNVESVEQMNDELYKKMFEDTKRGNQKP